MRPKKSLGQNFLKSKRVVADIIKAAELKPADLVLEVGPGKGILTEELLKQAGRVIAVEKDDRLIPFLQEKFSKEVHPGQLELIHKDVLEFNVDYELRTTNYKLIANIPYYITGALIKKFLTAKNQPSRMVLLVQREVAERIIARDGHESILSISTKAYGTPRKIKNVPAKYFSPQPKVDSAILVIENISRDFFVKHRMFDKIDSASVRGEEKFFKLVRAGFASKRKKLQPKLKKFGISQKTFEKCGINPNARAENLTPEQWKCLLF